MSVLTADYTGAQILIYDLDGNHLIDTKISEHNKTDKQIRVNVLPPSLTVNDECKLFILSSPCPCEYQGKIKKIAGLLTIAMFQGQIKENRTATRYKVNTPATVDEYISNKKNYPLFSPINVTLINISTSGVRFRAPFYSLNDGDQFRINMIISGSSKSLNAEVINHLDNEPEHSDYGCRFI